MRSEPDLILVIGATGRIGQHVVRALAASGRAVRVLSRDPAKAAALFPGADAASGDLDRPDSLAAAMSGVAKIYLASAIGAGMIEQHRHVIAAARRAGVRHVVRVSTEVAAADSPFTLGRWHRICESDLEASGLDHTHLRPCNFMHNMLVFQPSIARSGEFSAPFGDGRMALVDVRDIAAVAAAALTEAGHAGKAYTITGDDWLSYHEIAAIIGEAIGRRVIYRPISPDEERAAMRRAGRPDWLIEDLIVMYDVLARDTAPPTTDVVRRLTGRAPVRFAQFARETADIFAGRSAFSARHDG